VDKARRPRETAKANGDADADASLGFRYRLRLYVSGPTPLSARAVVNARRLFDEHLKGRYELEIIDIADNVASAIEDQVVAAPTLVKLSPAPVRRFIGDMSNAGRILRGLDVVVAVPPDAAVAGS
jgi:circadian clock protein KaiB